MVVSEPPKWVTMRVALYIKGCFMEINDFVISIDTKREARKAQSPHNARHLLCCPWLTDRPAPFICG
jgi:hypothetical protein